VVSENISKSQMQLQEIFTLLVEAGQYEEVGQSEQTLGGATENHEKHTVMQ
jgi:hypothetical protein